MNKKFLSAILFGALMVSSTGTFVSCKDYDEDIDRIDNTLNDLKSKLDALQTKVDAGKYVTNITKAGDGITITWNDNSTSTIETIKGDKGDKGDAVEISIDPTTKNWIIDGEDTGICAQGKDGNSTNGVSAKSPSIDATTGNWVVYAWDADKQEYVGTDTGVSAKGASAYVVDEGNYYTLNVAADKAGTSYTTVKLPKSPTVITEIEVLGYLYTPDSYEDGKWVPMNVDAVENTAYSNFIYNFTLVDDAILNADAMKAWNKEAGVKKIIKGQALSSVASWGSNLLVRVAPASLDASQLSFKLINSKMTEAPFVLGTPEAYNGLLSRAAVSGNGLWAIPVSAKEGMTYKDADAYKAQFTVTGKNYDGGPRDQAIVFALQEKDGFATNYNLAFAYNQNLNLDATATTINKSTVSPVPVELGETNTVTFDNIENVYDAHLHFNEADVIRWGIEYTDGISFKVTKLADQITVPSFSVNVHYVTLKGEVKKTTLSVQPAKAYAGITELASNNIAIVKDQTKNNFEASLAPMFTDLGTNNTALWKSDVESHKVTVYRVKSGTETEDTSISGVTVTFDKKELKDITKVKVSIDGATVLDHTKNYYALIEFYDEANTTGNKLNTVKAPFTISIPSLASLLVKEEAVFTGTTLAKAYMNSEDAEAATENDKGIKASTYSFKYAFKNFADAFKDGTTITFAINADQKFGNDKVSTLAKLNNANAAGVQIELTNNEKAYNKAINIDITAASYLGKYTYTKEEREAAAFSIQVMSPIERGTVDSATGSAIEVEATDLSKAKLVESDFKATTYNTVAYHIFPEWISNASAFASVYIKDVAFKSENENVFKVGTRVAATAKAASYVPVEPMNIAQTTVAPVKVTVTDVWGYVKDASIDVKVIVNK